MLLSSVIQLKIHTVVFILTILQVVGLFNSSSHRFDGISKAIEQNPLCLVETQISKYNGSLIDKISLSEKLALDLDVEFTCTRDMSKQIVD
jgi:hypothetical protein